MIQHHRIEITILFCIYELMNFDASPALVKGLLLLAETDLYGYY